jgi:prepilin-type N-terminal cleavage/methylation domain-containing protein
MQKQHGFTIPELFIAILLVAVLAVFAFSQEQAAQASRRDESRKISINSMYFYLEEVYFAAHGSYPATLTAENMKGVDPDLLRDGQGKLVGTKDADFRYEPSDCTGDQCKRYTLRADLEKEADFVRESRHK